jgi:hypothetical protein
MVSLVSNPYLLLAARVILGAVFLSAALAKLPRQQQFILVVTAYRMLPWALARPYARILPWVESVVGAGLLLGVASRVLAGVCAMLLVSFSFAIVVNLLRGKKTLPCGCRGPQARHTIGTRVLVRNAFLLVLAAYTMSASGESVVSVKLLKFAAPGNPGIVSAGHVFVGTTLLFTVAPILSILWQIRRRAQRREEPRSVQVAHGAVGSGGGQK